MEGRRQRRFRHDAARSKHAGKPIVFCPECLAPTLHPWTGKSLLEFTNRQILITRVYSLQALG